jgi:hypothetical protein
MSTGRLVTLQVIVMATLLALAAGMVLIVNPARAELSEPPCTITGTSGNNVLEGSAGDDVICGGGGNDTIKGLAGNDILRGEAGGGDKLFGGVGDDTLDGGLGSFDLASYRNYTKAVTASLADGIATGEGSDVLISVEGVIGSEKNDSLTGSVEADILSGERGMDNIWGMEEADAIRGGGNADTLRGGLGNDLVLGNGGPDNLFGEEGDDALNSRDNVSGNDSLDGGDDAANCTTDVTEKSVVNCKDATAPTVKSTRPTGRKVSVRANVTATFSEAIDQATITGATFKLFKKKSTVAIPATVTYDATKKMAILNPNAKLRRGATYRALVTTEVADLAGNKLGTAKAWSFTTRKR